MTEPTTTAMSVSAQGGITLSTYVNLLRSAADARLPKWASLESSSLEHRAMRELLDEGLLSEARFAPGGGGIVFTEALVLTPAGANALLQWSDYLESRSPRSRTLRVLAQAFLVVIGGLIASIPEILAAL